MEKQEKSQPIFYPEQVNEQVEYLASIQDLQTQEATPGASTIAALQRISAENETILANVWTQLVLSEAIRQTLENESVVVDLLQPHRKKDDTMQKTDFIPQLNTIESQSKPAPRRSRRLFTLVAALLVVLFVSSFLTILSLTHINNTHAGSSQHATPSLSPTTRSMLPVPSNQVVFSTNPAAKIIDTIGMSTKVSNGLLPFLLNRFTVGQTIWLVCGAHGAPQPGVITIKWYSDNRFYKQLVTQPIKANQLVEATFNVIYGQPAEGKTEVYWNGQLAATLFFVVEP